MEKREESSAAQARDMSTHLPSEQSAAFNSATGALERNLKTVEVPENIESKGVPNTRLEELQLIKDLFPKLYEPLCVAERKTREILRPRSMARKEVMPKVKDSKEGDYLARKA